MRRKSPASTGICTDGFAMPAKPRYRKEILRCSSTADTSFSEALRSQPPRLPRALGRAQAAAGPFKLEPLSYPANAFEPYIDAKTMEIHHDRHHQAYVTNLNNAAKDNSALSSIPLHELLGKIGQLPESVRTVMDGGRACSATISGNMPII